MRRALWLVALCACGVGKPDTVSGDSATPRPTDESGTPDTAPGAETAETADSDTAPAAEPCAPERPAGVDWMALGPHPVGERHWAGTLSFQGEQQHLLQLVYPATVAGPDAPVDTANGPYPLLVFEHAGGSAYDQYDWLFSVLASRGWIVASAEHDANGWDGTSDWWGAHAFLADETGRLLIDWSDDPESEWYGAVDLGRIAVGGHSHGGGGVLRMMQSWRPMAPAAPYTVQAVLLITTRPDLEAAFSSYAGVYAGMPPLLNIGAGYDQDGSTAYGQAVAVYEPHGRPGAMLWVEGAEHYSFTDDVSDAYATIGRLQARSVAGQAAVAFLEAVLRDDPDATATLRGDAAPVGDSTPTWRQWHDAEASPIDAFEGAEDAIVPSGSIVGIPGQTFVNGFLSDSLADGTAQVDLVIAQIEELLPAGGQVLFFEDAARGIDTYGLALDALGAAVTVEETSDGADFADRLVAGSWDLVIAAQQDGSSGANLPFDTALADYACSGGKLILSDFRVASTGAAATLLCAGARYDGVTNWHTMTSASDLFSGSLASTNPGWGIYTYGLQTDETVYATNEFEVTPDHVVDTSDIGRAVTLDGFTAANEVAALDPGRGLYLPTWALELAWHAPGATVTWDVGDVDATAHPVLSVRLLPVHADPANPAEDRIDLDLAVVDADGTVGTWSLSEAAHGALRPTPEYLDFTGPKSIFETWRMPLRAVAERTPGLDLAHIAAVQLIATAPSGRVVVDDLEWSHGEGCW